MNKKCSILKQSSFFCDFFNLRAPICSEPTLDGMLFVSLIEDPAFSRTSKPSELISDYFWRKKTWKNHVHKRKSVSRVREVFQEFLQRKQRVLLQEFWQKQKTVLFQEFWQRKQRVLLQTFWRRNRKFQIFQVFSFPYILSQLLQLLLLLACLNSSSLDIYCL